MSGLSDAFGALADLMINGGLVGGAMRLKRHVGLLGCLAVLAIPMFLAASAFLPT